MKLSIPRGVLGVILGLFFGTLYLLTLNQNFTFDALTNALVCEGTAVAPWFHSNHPFFPFLGVLWFRLERLLGYEGWAVYSIARECAIFSSLGLAIYFASLSRFLSVTRAAIATIFLGSTYAVWFYAVDGYGLGMAFFFSSVLLAGIFFVNARATVGLQEAVFLAFLSCLYTLSHGIGIFHVFPLAWWLGWKSRESREEKPTRINPGLFYFAVFSFLLLFVYVFLFLTFVDGKKAGGLVSWMIGYASFNGVHNVLQSPFWTFRLTSIWEGLWKGWAQVFYSPSISPTLLQQFASAGFGVVGMGTLIASLFRARRLERSERRLSAMLFWWGLLVWIFLSFCSPGHVGFRLHLFLPWTAACALSFKNSRPFFRAQLYLAAGLLVLNFGGFYRRAFISNNFGFQTLSAINAQLKPGDYFICTAGEIPGLEGLRPYFFSGLNGGTLEGRLLEYREKNLESMALALKASMKRGHAVYFSQRLFDKAAQEGIEKNYSLEPGAIGKFLKGFAFDEAFVLSDGTKVIRVKEPGSKRIGAS